MEGFADRSAPKFAQSGLMGLGDQAGGGFEKFPKFIEANAQSVLQCKASLIAAGLQTEGCGIFKNIQPISVGV